MRWFLLVVLVFGCFGFSQSVSTQFNAEEILAYFSSNEFFESGFYEIAREMREYNYTDKSEKKLQMGAVFTQPREVFQPIQITDTLIQNIDTVISHWQPTNIEFKSRHRDDFKGMTVARINYNNENGIGYELTALRNYFQVPTFYKDKFEGYTIVPDGLPGLTGEYHYVTDYVYRSFEHKYPLKIGKIDSKQLASWNSEPLLYDFFWYGQLQGWPEDKHRLMWINGSRAVSATSGQVFEILNEEGQIVNFSDVTPEFTISVDGKIDASLPIIFNSIQDAVYSEDYTLEVYESKDFSKIQRTVTTFLPTLVLLIIALVSRWKKKRKDQNFQEARS